MLMAFWFIRGPGRETAAGIPYAHRRCPRMAQIPASPAAAGIQFPLTPIGLVCITIIFWLWNLLQILTVLGPAGADLPGTRFRTVHDWRIAARWMVQTEYVDFINPIPRQSVVDGMHNL